MKSQALRSLLLVCLGALCIVGTAYQFGHSRRTPPPEQAQSSPPRLAALLTRLDSALAPNSQGTWRSGVAAPTPDPSRSAYTTFSVESTDERGRALYNVVWDERSGSYHLSFERPILKARSQHRLTNAARAATAAREWLDDLGIAQESDHWRLAGDPQRLSVTWQARFRSPDRDVLLTVRSDTAEITAASVQVVASASHTAPTAVSQASPIRHR